MNWFKFAQISNFLSAKGYSKELVNYISSLPKHVQKLIGQIINQNPDISEDQLKEKIPSLLNAPVSVKNTNPVQNQIKRKDMVFPYENKLIESYSNYPVFQKWIRSVLARERILDSKKISDTNNVHPYYRSQVLEPMNPNKLMMATMERRLNLILDWYNAMNDEELGYRLDISGYNIDDAWRRQEEWHKEIINNSENINFGPIKKQNIVYGPKWEDPRFNGWTIQKITTENDMRAEGCKVGHCIKDNYTINRLKNGESEFFSLRDSNNNPMVSMEVSPPGSYNFRQIYGNGPKTGNADPSSDKKQAIGEWLKTLPKYDLNDFDGTLDYDEVPSKDIDDYIESKIFGYSDYGTSNITKFELDDVMNAVEKEIRYRNSYNSSEMHYASKVIAKACIEKDILELNKINENQIISRAKGLFTGIPKYPFVHNPRDSERIPNDAAITRIESMIDPIDINNCKERAIKDFEFFKSLANSKKEDLEEKIKRRTLLFLSQIGKYKAKDFDTNSKNEKIKYDSIRCLGKVLDLFMQCGQSLNLRDEKIQDIDLDYSHYDPEPDRSEFDTEKEYGDAYKKWEKDEEYNQNYYFKEAIDNNLDYAFPYYIAENIIENISNYNIKIPTWMTEEKYGTSSFYNLIAHSNKKEASVVFDLFKFSRTK